MDEQKRLLLALVLMAVVVVVMTSLWPSQPGQQQPQGQASSSAGGDSGVLDSEDAGADEGDAGAPSPESPADSPRREVRELLPEKRVGLRTKELVVELTTHGGGLVKAELQDERYRTGWGEEERQLDLVSVNTEERPELTPLAFTLVQKQLRVPRGGQTAEGRGVLRFVNDGSLDGARLEAVAQLGAKVASKIAGHRPYATLEALEKAIGGSPSQRQRVLGKLLEAAWGTGRVQLDFEVLREEEDRVVLRGLTDNDVEVVRTVSIASDFELRIVDRLRNLGSKRLNLRERLMATGLETLGGSSGWFQRPTGQLAGLCAVNDELIRSTRSQLSGESSGCTSSMGCGGPSGPRSQRGNVRFVAVDRHFFMTATSPSPRWGESSCDLRADAQGQLIVTVEPVVFTEVDGGGQATYASTTYLGPKRYSILRDLGPGRRLWEAINYGWFAPLSHILLRALRIFHGWLGNWGLAIILLTLIIKTLLLPITHKSMKSMRKMQAEMAVLKPQMDVINERYKDQPDVKQQKLLELYQQNGINPLKQMSGCLPMFLQMPIWIALYRMISESVELYRAPFYLWLNDLSAQDPYYVLPALLGVAMFLQQLVTPQPGVDNAQAKMMRWMMPAMFLFIMINMPAGLVLYIFANTLLTIVQQQIINRMIPAPVTPGDGKSGGGGGSADDAEADSETRAKPSRKKSKRRKKK